MTTWKLTGAANQDLLEMFLHGLRTFGAAQAEKYRSGIVDAFENIALFPKLARVRTEFKQPVRVFHHESHYIIYTIQKGSVLILRILRDEADLEQLFGLIP